MAPKKVAEGVCFPVTKNGERSTTETNRNAIAASLEKLDKNAADNARKERDWRHQYNKHIVKQVELSLLTPESALDAARAGLDYLHSSFEFVRDSVSLHLNEAMSKFTGTFHTGVLKGKKKLETKAPFVVQVNGQTLKGKELEDQVNQWAELGIIEPSAAKAIKMAVAESNQQWWDLSDKYFVLLGAGSAMGPLEVLLSRGANIIAVDIDRPHVWKRLFSMVENSPGTLTFPSRSPVDTPDPETVGCNLFTDTPEIANWIKTLYADKSLVIGCYAYMDGELFVRVSLAMDAIVQEVVPARKTQTTLAYLCTPTDCHVVPAEAHAAQKVNKANEGIISNIFKPFGFCRDNTREPVRSRGGDQFHVVDGLVVAQGPNYALAKRLQHWRSMVAREDHGCIVSTNIAPSTATKSVVSNKQFAAAYGGFHHFKPMKVFEQETSNAVMGAMLIHDINNDKCAAHPKNKLANPLCLFSEGSCHGGVWRAGSTIDSIGVPAAMMYYLTSPLAKLGLACVVLLFVVAFAFCSR